MYIGIERYILTIDIWILREPVITQAQTANQLHTYFQYIHTKHTYTNSPRVLSTSDTYVKPLVHFTVLDSTTLLSFTIHLSYVVSVKIQVKKIFIANDRNHTSPSQLLLTSFLYFGWLMANVAYLISYLTFTTIGISLFPTNMEWVPMSKSTVAISVARKTIN